MMKFSSFYQMPFRNVLESILVQCFFPTVVMQEKVCNNSDFVAVSASL
uniref:Uncharacterized protein n=1 Tax=Anguilla anguilla TaxID=7936 RepID=A0A0E9UYA0_ANGAN